MNDAQIRPGVQVYCVHDQRFRNTERRVIAAVDDKTVEIEITGHCGSFIIHRLRETVRNGYAVEDGGTGL